MQSRNAVFQELVALKSELESEILSNTHLINGLAAVVKSNPDIDQETYSFYGSELIKLEPSIKNLALAQDYIVRQTYPLAGNENVIGVDYREMPTQKIEAERVQELQEIVISGPHNLVQGWKGVLGRVPIFDKDNNFWGFITAVIKLDELLEEVGLREYTSRINMAIETSSGTSGGTEVFYGDASLFSGDSVIVDVNLSNGLWRIAAQPNGGWPRFAPNRALVMISAILAAITTMVLGVLIFKYFKYTEETTKRLTTAYHQAEYSSRAKNTFLASVSHELRTPLNNIVGFTDVMQQGVHGDLNNNKYKEYVSHIGNSGRHLTAIIDNILDLARIEAGEYTLKMEQVGILKELKEVIDKASPRVEKKSICINQKVPEREIYILADQGRFRQILTTILVNAIKETPTGSEVSIDVINGGKNAYISIKDHGPGLDEQEISKILRPFGTPSNPDEEGDSSGLGLSVSVEFAKLMNGSIEIESEKGQGTKMTFKIPLA
ncbi:ATP-binding protein [Pseudemcibacter aquimaris]|uniref:sensor histidine kinase n=1 Tax=Pseudemcibacter aquimaris TaxID=2857064 RepID=UPI002013199D|nr:ATP-binding protein [Pseudemcibacter aquimaris]MCC3859616.1 CHASE domain-containing protein [Pseudemcibacter aquimaris]WDU60011.1 CHASE domain-containing protein [Pseudemcibacter aquimaris]